MKAELIWNANKKSHLIYQTESQPKSLNDLQGNFSKLNVPQYCTHHQGCAYY